MRVALEIVGGPIAQRRVVLELPAVIGRSRTVQLTIAHPLVSRRHCELLENGAGMLLVRDLDSTNGTYIGQQRISEAVVEPGGEFTIGPLTFRPDYQLPDSGPPRSESPWAELPAAIRQSAEPSSPVELPGEAPAAGGFGDEAGAAAQSEAGASPLAEPGDDAATRLPSRREAANREPPTRGTGPAPRAAPRRRPPSWSDGQLADSRWHFPTEPIEQERFNASAGDGPPDGPPPISEAPAHRPAPNPFDPQLAELTAEPRSEAIPEPDPGEADPAAPPEPTSSKPPVPGSDLNPAEAIDSAEENVSGGRAKPSGGEGTADEIDPALRDFFKGLP